MSQIVEPSEAEPLEAIPVEEQPPRPWLVITSWLLFAVVILGAGVYVYTLVDPSGDSLVARYVNGDTGQSFQSIHDQIGVELPTSARRRVESGPLGDTVTVESSPGSGYLFSVTKTPEPEAALENFKPLLDRSARAVAKNFHGQIVGQTKAVALGDLATKDVYFRRGNTYTRVRFILAIDRLYTLVAQTTSADDKAFNRFVLSFVPLGLN